MASRKTISPNLYKGVVYKQGSRCYWCWCEVVRISDIPEADRIKVKGLTLVYYQSQTSAAHKTTNQSQKTYKRTAQNSIATIDHVINVADGGTNDLNNLVISCFACNQKRDRESKSLEPTTNWFFGSKSIQYGYWQQCPHCQNKKFNNSRKEGKLWKFIKAKLKKWFFKDSFCQIK